MNKNIYKKVWNTSRGCLVAVEETKTSKGKAKTAAVLIASAILIPSLTYAVTSPSYPSIVVSANPYKIANLNIGAKEFERAEINQSGSPMLYNTFVNLLGTQVLSYDGIEIAGGLTFAGQADKHYFVMNTDALFPSANNVEMNIKSVTVKGNAVFTVKDLSSPAVIYAVQAQPGAKPMANRLKVDGSMSVGVASGLGRINYFIANGSQSGAKGTGYTEVENLNLSRNSLFIISHSYLTDPRTVNVHGELIVHKRITVGQGASLRNHYLTVESQKKDNANIGTLRAESMIIAGTYVQADDYWSNATYGSVIDKNIDLKSSGQFTLQGDLIIGAALPGNPSDHNINVGESVTVSALGATKSKILAWGANVPNKSLKISGSGAFTLSDGRLDISDAKTVMSSGRLTTGGKLELGGMDISGGEIKIQSNASLTSSTSSSVDISGGNILNNGELLIEQGVGRNFSISGGKITTAGSSSSVAKTILSTVDFEPGVFTTERHGYGTVTISDAQIGGTINVLTADKNSTGSTEISSSSLKSGGGINLNSGDLYISSLDMQDGVISVNVAAANLQRSNMQLDDLKMKKGTITNRSILTISKTTFGSSNSGSISSTSEDGKLVLNGVTMSALNTKINVSNGTLEIGPGEGKVQHSNEKTTTNSALTASDVDIVVGEKWSHSSDITVNTGRSFTVKPSTGSSANQIKADIDGLFTNNGTVTVNSGSALEANEFKNYTVVINNGAINVVNGGLTNYSSSNYTNASSASSLETTNLVVEAGSTFTNNGTVRVSASGLASSVDSVENKGTITTNRNFYIAKSLLNTNTFTNKYFLGAEIKSGQGDARTEENVIKNAEDAVFSNAGGNISVWGVQNKGLFENTGSMSLKGDLSLEGRGSTFEMSSGYVSAGRVLLDTAGSTLNLTGGAITTHTLQAPNGTLNLSNSTFNADIWNLDRVASETSDEGYINLSDSATLSILYVSNDAEHPDDGANTLFVKSADVPISFSYVQDGDGGSLVKDATAVEDYYRRSGGTLSDDERLEKLTFADRNGASFYVRGTNTGLTKADIAEYKAAWAQKFDKVDESYLGYLQFEDEGLDDPDAMNRLTVVVADKLAKRFDRVVPAGKTASLVFYDGQLDGRRSIGTSIGAIEDIYFIANTPDAQPGVDQEKSYLGEGFGFDAIRYAKSVTLNGSTLTLSGVTSGDPEMLLASSDGIGSKGVNLSLDAGSTLNLGLDVVVGAENAAKGQGTLVSVSNLQGTVKVKNGDYRIGTWSNTGNLEIKSVSGKASSLTLGLITKDTGTTNLGPTGTLKLNTAEATPSRLNKLVSDGGKLVVWDGDYTLGTFNTVNDSVLDVSVEKHGALGGTLRIENQGEVKADYTVKEGATLVFGTDSTPRTKIFESGGKITLEAGTDVNPGGTLLINKETHVKEIEAEGAQYVQTAGTLISEKGWFTNSTLTVSGGYINASNIKDSEGNAITNSEGAVVGDLGANTYIIGTNSAVALPSTGTNPHDPWNVINWTKRQEKFARVSADSIDSDTIVHLKSGGLLQVKNMNLDIDRQGTIILEGGVFETTSEQFFSAWTNLETLPIYKEEESEVLEDPGVQYGKGEVHDPIEANIQGLSGKIGTIVLSDDRLFVNAALSIVEGIKSNRNLGEDVQIEFSGHVLGEFTVDEAHKFMESEQPTHSVIFDHLALANKLNGNTENKILRIGSSKDGITPGRNKMQIEKALGFTKVTNANEVSVNDDRELVLVGEANNWNDYGWSSFNDIVHEYDEDRFNETNAFLPDAELGQSKLVIGAATDKNNPTTLTLGSAYTDYISMGWVDHLEVGQGAQLNARKGEYALWTIKNANGHFNVEKDAYVHTRGTVDVGIGRGEWNIYGQLHFAKDQELGNGSSDEELATADLTGTLNNYGIVDGSLPSQMTLNGVANNYAGAEIRVYAGAAKGKITNYGASEKDGIDLPAAVFKQVQRNGLTDPAKQVFRLFAKDGVTTFDNQGIADFINLKVEDGATFDNKASFAVSNSLVVSGGDFEQRGEAISSAADLTLDSSGLYVNHALSESRFAGVEINPKSAEDASDSKIDNYGSFIVTNDFTNSGVFNNQPKKKTTDGAATMRVEHGKFHLLGGTFNNNQGTTLTVADGISLLEALNFVDEDGATLSSDPSLLDNKGTVVLQNVKASGQSKLTNGYAAKNTAAESVSLTAQDLDFESAYLKNYAELNASGGSFSNDEPVDSNDQKLLLDNEGVLSFANGLTLSNAWAENAKGSNVANGKLITSKLDLIGEFSQLKNTDIAQLGTIEFTGQATILNSGSASNLTGSSLTNKGYGDVTVEPAELILHNEGTVELSDAIDVFGSLDLENGKANKDASFEAASLTFREDDSHDGSHLTNEGVMNFLGKDGKGVDVEGLTITNAKSHKASVFKGPFLTLRDSSFDNYNLADFRNVAEDGRGAVKGVSLDHSDFINNGTSLTSNAKLYGKSLSLQNDSALINKGLADFRYTGEGYDKAGSVVIDASKVQTGVGSNWAEFYGADLEVRNQQEQTRVSFENQAKAEFTGDAAINNSVVVSGTKNISGDKKATFKAASLTVDGGKFVNGSQALLQTDPLVEGEEPIHGDLVGLNGSVITNGLNFSDETGQPVENRTLNANALIKGKKLTLGPAVPALEGGDDSRFINVATAEFSGDISAKGQSSISNLILKDKTGVMPKLSGLGLTLDQESSLANNGQASFDGSVLIENGSFAENTSVRQFGPASFTGHDLSLNGDQSHFTNSGTASFAANDEGIGTGEISVAGYSYIENLTDKNFGQKASLDASSLALDDHAYFTNQGKASFGETSGSGAITADNSSYIENTTTGRSLIERAELTGSTLTLNNGSYLENTSGSVLLTGEIDSRGSSYIESISDKNLGSSALAQLKASAMTLEDGRFTNTGSAVFGINENVTSDDGSVSTQFVGGAITATNAEFLNGAIKVENEDGTSSVEKSNLSGIVLQAGNVKLNTGSFDNYASVVIENADLTDTEFHNDAESSIRFTERFVIESNKDLYNGGSISGNGLFEVTGYGYSENRAKLVNDGSGSATGASITAAQFVAGDNTIVENTKTTIVAEDSTEIGGDFALKALSSLDTGKLSAASTGDTQNNYLMNLEGSKVFAGSAEIGSNLSLDETSVFTVGKRKSGETALGTTENPNSAVFTGQITNKGQIASYVTVTQSGKVNDSENLLGEIKLADGITYTAEDGLYAANVTGKGVVFNQVKDGHVTIAEGGQWLHNSEVNITAGSMDAAELGKNGLSNNLYRVAYEADPTPQRPHTGLDNQEQGNDPYGELQTWYVLPSNWKDTQVVLKADSIARSANAGYGSDERKGSIVEVYEGGVFSVNKIVLDGKSTGYTEAFIKLKGGALETTLDQIFAGEHHQPALGVDEENPKNPSSMVEYFESLKAGVTTSISTDPDNLSYFVFTDDNVLASTAASAVSLLNKADYKANVAFTGKSFENFNVDQANRLQAAVSSDPANPLNYKVVFTDTILDNTTAETGSDNRSMIIGRLDPATEASEGSNVVRTKELGLGFKAVSNADDITIQEGNEFVLVGFNGKETIDGYEFGKSHEPTGPLDSELFNEKTKLLTDASDAYGNTFDSEGRPVGGSILVKDGSTLSLGTQFNTSNDSRTLGWVDAVDLSNDSNVVVRGGEFALWALNTGAEAGNKVIVKDTGILHTDQITGSADVINGGILYVENSTGKVFNGSVANKGVFDTRGETVLNEDGLRFRKENTFSLSGALADLSNGTTGELTAVYNLRNDVGSQSIHDKLIVEDGAKVLNDGGFEGNSLEVDETALVINNGNSAWVTTNIDGEYLNKGTLELGKGPHLVAGDGLLDNFKGLTAVGSIEVIGTFNNRAGAQTHGENSLNITNKGLVNNNSAMSFDAVKLDDLAAEFHNNNAASDGGNASLEARSLEVLGIFDNDGRVTVKDRVVASEEGSEPTVAAGNFALNGGLVDNKGVFDISGAADNRIEAGAFDNKGSLLASDMIQNAGDVTNSGAGSVKADSWTMSGGSFTNEAANYTKKADGTLKDIDVVIDGDFTQNGGSASNAGAMSAKNLSLAEDALSFVNEGARSLLDIEKNISHSAGTFRNEGSVTVGGDVQISGEASQFNNTIDQSQEKTVLPTIAVVGNINQDAAQTKNDGAIRVGYDPKGNAVQGKGNWTISGAAQGLKNTTDSSLVTLAGDINQAAGLVFNKGSIEAQNWTVQTKEDTTNPVRGIENRGSASKIELSGNLDQSAGNLLNEGKINIAGDWTESGSVRTIDNLKDTTVENAANPTIRVGGNIRQEHGFVTNEGKVEAGYDAAGNAVVDKGNWTIDGITMGLKNQGEDSEIKLAGDLTQLFGHVENEGAISADDYTIDYNPERVFGDVVGAGASGLTNKGTVKLTGSITQTSGFASNEGEITAGFDKDGSVIEGKGNWSIDEKSTGFENKGAKSSVKLAGNFTQSVGDGLNEGTFAAHNYTMNGVASGLDNQATVNEDGTVNTPSVTLTGSITQSSGMVNNEGRISAGYAKDGAAIADEGDWNYSGTAEGMANKGADTTVTLAGNITQSSGFVSNDGHMTVGFNKDGSAIEGKGNWNVNAPSATGFSNNLETSEIKLAGSINQEVGEATNKGLITAHDWTVTGSADGISNLGENSRVELTGNLAQLHGDIVNEGTMIGVDEKGELGLDNTYTAAGDNTNTGVFIFKGDMTQRAGDITNSRVDGGLPSEEDKFGTFTVGSITKSGGTIDNSALFTANGDVSQSAGSITNRDGGVMNLNGNLTVSEGSVSNLGDKSVINTGKAVFESADAAVATPVTNEGTINLESAKFALGSSLDNTGTINFKDFVSFDSMSEFRNDGNILETVDPDRVERTKVSIGDGINFATSGEIKADVLEIGSGTSYSAEDNSVNTFKTADFGKDNTQLHVGSGAAFTLNGEKPTDVFKLGSTTVASNEGVITLNNVAAANDGYLNNAGGTILINQGTKFINKGRTEPATEAASEKLGGITGGSVIIDAGAHLVNSGTLTVDNLRQSANSVGSIFTVNEEGKQVVSDDTDTTRAHFHQYGGSLKVKNDWFENTNIYVEKGAKIVVEDPDGTIRSLGNNNLYVLRSGEDRPEVVPTEVEVNGKNEVHDLRLKYEDEYLNTDKYVRFKVKDVTLDGNNVFKLESGGTLEVEGLDKVSAKSEPTIILDGGGVQVSLGQVFKEYPLGVGQVKDSVKEAIDWSNAYGFLVFDDENYTVEDVITARRNIDRVTAEGSVNIAFLGTINKEAELLVSKAHNFTEQLDDEDRQPVYLLGRNTLGNDRLPEGYGTNTIRIGNIKPEADNYTIQESILVKNVGKAVTVEPSYEAVTISVEDGRSFGLAGWLESENDGKSYDDESSRLFKETDGKVRVKNGTFGLGGLGNRSLAEDFGETAKGWLGEVVLEDKGRMEIYEGQFAINNVTNQGLIHVKRDAADLHLKNYTDELNGLVDPSDRAALIEADENGSVQKGVVNEGHLHFEQDSDSLYIDSSLHNMEKGTVDLAANISSLVVSGLVDDHAGFINDKDDGQGVKGANNVNSGLKQVEIKSGGKVINRLAHNMHSLVVDEGGLYVVEAGRNDSGAYANWTQTKLEGGLRISENAQFKVREDLNGASETTFGGAGYIVNAGTLDLTNVDKATIGHIYNEDDAPEIENATRAAGIVRFNELTITAVSGEPKGSADHPAVVDKISFNPEAGEVFGRILNVESAHNFINKGAVTLEESLNLKDSNRFDNSGALTAKEAINLGSSHALNNSGVIRTQRLNQGGFEAASEDETEPKSLGGSVVNTNEIYTAELNQGIGSSLVNKGYIRFSASPLDAVRESTENYIEKKKANVGLEVSPETVFVVKGDITNEHIIDASAVDKTYIGGADKENYFRTQYGAVSVFNDLEVNGKGQVINSGTDIGQYLTVNKDAKYTVDATGVSLWTDVFVIEGELEVIKGGTLTVQRDQGASVSTYSNALVPENAEVHGKFKNHGLSRFHNLTLKEKSESHNNGNIVGGHLLQEKSAGIHTTSEISNSTWEVVEINEGLENAGTFTINEALVANAKIHNTGNFSVGEKVVEQVLTHEFDNEGTATFNDLTLQAPEESVLLAEAPRTDLDLGEEEGSESGDVGTGETPTNPGEAPSAGDLSGAVRFINHGAGKEVTTTGKFEINAGFDVIVDDGAKNTHEDLVLKGGTLRIINGSNLEVTNKTQLSGGEFIIGTQQMTRDLSETPTITSVTTEVDGKIGSKVEILEGGDLRFGKEAYAQAAAAGASFREGSPRLILSQPIELTSTGSIAVGASAAAAPGGASFGSDSQLIVNFAQLSEAPAITGAGGALSVEKGAEVQVNVTGIHKGRYYITQDFENTNAVGNQWEGGWKDNLVLIPRDMVARWKVSFGNDGTNTWIDANQTEKPDVAAPDVAGELLDKEPPGPGAQIVQNLLNGENGIDPETAKKAYNSLVNIGFAGAQMATAYSTLTNAADAVQNRGSMIAEGFNRDGWRAHKTRTGDAWIQVLGSRDRVERYDASKIKGGYESKSTGFIGGIARNLESANATVGAAISYQRGQAKSKEGVMHTENRFYTFGAEVYGNWSPNPLINIIGDAGYYYNEGKIDQRLVPESGFRKANTRVHTNMYTIGARAESTLKVGQASVIPHVGVRWIHGKSSKYDTKLDGQTAFNSTPKATDTWQFPLGISVRGDITTKSGWKIRPTADVSVILQAGDRSQSVLFGSPEVSATNMIYGRFTGDQIYVGQLGVQIEKGTVTYGIRYGYSTGGYGKSDHEIKVEAIWRF